MTEHDISDVQPQPDNGHEYMTVHNFIYVKMYEDPTVGKIIKQNTQQGKVIRTTGKVWTGRQGGLWEEIDLGFTEAEKAMTAGDYPRWVLLEGPGFDVRGPMLVERRDGMVFKICGCGELADVAESLVCSRKWTISRLISELAARWEFDRRDVVMMSSCPYSSVKRGRGKVDKSREMDAVFAKRGDILNPAKLLDHCNINGWLYLASLGLCADLSNAHAPSELAMRDSEPSESLDLRLSAPPEPMQTGSLAEFTVAHPVVVVRASPSTEAKMLTKIYAPSRVWGLPHKCENDPWLLLSRDECQRLNVKRDVAWVLIHGACLGLGALLKKVVDETAPGLPPEKVEERRAPLAIKSTRRVAAEAEEDSPSHPEELMEEDTWVHEERTQLALVAEKKARKKAERRETELLKQAREAEVAAAAAREEARRADEEARKAAEEARQADEKLRKEQKEAHRQEEEAKRQAEEAKRQEAEAEAIRQEEAALKQKEDARQLAAAESARRIAAERLKEVENKLSQMETESRKQYEEEVARKAAEQESQKTLQAMQKLREVEEKLKKLEMEKETLQASKSEEKPQNMKGVSASDVSAPGGPPEEWGVESAVQFLYTIELGNLEEIFRENSIDGEMLLSLSFEELVEDVGLKRMHAKKIKRKLESLIS